MEEKGKKIVLSAGSVKVNNSEPLTKEENGGIISEEQSPTTDRYAGKAHWRLLNGEPVFEMGEVDRSALSESIKDVFNSLSDPKERGKYLQNMCSLFSLPTSIVSTLEGDELRDAVNQQLDSLDISVSAGGGSSKPIFSDDMSIEKEMGSPDVLDETPNLDEEGND